MSVDSDIESEETVREEYELFLYGFTVDDFIDDSELAKIHSHLLFI